jgi:FkbM family methyltransferase
MTLKLNKVIFKVFNKLRNLAYRLELLWYSNLFRKKGFKLPKDLFKTVIRNPYIYDNYINLLPFISPNESIILIDIGANVGSFSLNFSKFFDLKKAYLFEPLDFLNERIDQNLKNLNYEIFNVGLGNINATQDIFYDEKKNVLASFKEYSTEIKENYSYTGDLKKKKIHIKKLDEILNFDNNKFKVVLKIDTQGFEVEVLEGSKKLLKKVSILIIECSFFNQYQDNNASFVRCCEILSKYNLYPIVFKFQGKRFTRHFYENDVIFVKLDQAKNILYRNIML